MQIKFSYSSYHSTCLVYNLQFYKLVSKNVYQYYFFVFYDFLSLHESQIDSHRVIRTFIQFKTRSIKKLCAIKKEKLFQILWWTSRKNKHSYILHMLTIRFLPWKKFPFVPNSRKKIIRESHRHVLYFFGALNCSAASWINSCICVFLFCSLSCSFV